MTITMNQLFNKVNGHACNVTTEHKVGYVESIDIDYLVVTSGNMLSGNESTITIAPEWSKSKITQVDVDEYQITLGDDVKISISLLDIIKSKQ